MASLPQDSLLLHALLGHLKFSPKAWNKLPGSISFWFLAFLHFNSYLLPSRTLKISWPFHVRSKESICPNLQATPFSNSWKKYLPRWPAIISPILKCGPSPYMQGCDFTLAAYLAVYFNSYSSYWTYIINSHTVHIAELWFWFTDTKRIPGCQWKLLFQWILMTFKLFHLAFSCT